MQRFPFQLEGADFLSALGAALLADEMGLGKTIQAVDAADGQGAQRVLVICKAVGKSHWLREFQRHSRIERPGQVLQADTWLKSPRREPLLAAVNYDIVHRPEVLGQLIDARWDVLVCDEMHMLKGGVETRRGQAVLDPARGIHNTAESVWGLSGTPAPNHVGELHPWLRALHPDLLEQYGVLDQEAFLNRFVVHVKTQFGIRPMGTREADTLRELLAPVMLRRMRRNVLPQLPDLVIDEMPLDHDTGRKMIAQASNLADERDMLLRILDTNPDLDDLIALDELGLSALRRLTGMAKTPAVAEYVRQELEGHDKVVVMAWHRDVIENLARDLADFNPVVLHGGTPDADKETAESRFQDNPEHRVFIGQILTAGTTITLTAASRMVMAEWSWSPDDNEQAILRILRIGQDRKCRVTFAGLAGSLDEAVMRVYARKAAAIAEVID
jgi:SNF2 family DNA or RNA helicase